MPEGRLSPSLDTHRDTDTDYMLKIIEKKKKDGEMMKRMNPASF